LLSVERNTDNAVWHVHPNGLGQWQENGRDRGDSLTGPQLPGAICEIARNQGYGPYGYDYNRFPASVEYISEYNTREDVPYVTHVNCEYRLNATISLNGDKRVVRSGTLTVIAGSKPAESLRRGRARCFRELIAAVVTV
jgi:hypothetical protein